MFGMQVSPILILGLSLAFAGNAFATTWGPEKATCPLCGTEDEFYAPMSYGAYIYGWPSKYHYIFWPRIDDRVLYACRKCSFVCFMWDFKSVPEEKKEALKKVLHGIELPPPVEPKDERKKEDPVYDLIPMDARLSVAEKVYTVLGLDDEQWCVFHRTAAYHYDRAKMGEKAKAAREKALALVEKLIAQKDNAARQKELLLISGAMRHFLGKDQEALADFRKAISGAPFKVEKLDEEKNAGKDKYLSELLTEYIQQIEQPKVPAAANTEK